MCKKRNQGMSLVEVVVVLSIMVILTGVITVGLGTATSKPAEECAEKIVNALNACRVSTMGKEDTKLQFYISNDSVYVKEFINGSEVKNLPISGKGVIVKYKYKSGDEFNLSDTPLNLSYNRSTGGFEECAPGKFCSQIIVSKGSRSVTVKLYDLTGKVSLEK